MQYTVAGFYPIRDDFEYTCTKCPEPFTTAGPGATSLNECTGQMVLQKFILEGKGRGGKN